MVVVFAFGEGWPNPSELTGVEMAHFGALILMMIGALIAWRWELIGAVTLLAGFGLFWGFGGSYPGGYFNLFPLAGCLHLIAWLLEHQPVKVPEVEPVKKTKNNKKKKRRRGRKR
jgi:hypothetical protein